MQTAEGRPQRRRKCHVSRSQLCNVHSVKTKWATPKTNVHAAGASIRPTWHTISPGDGMISSAMRRPMRAARSTRRSASRRPPTRNNSRPILPTWFNRWPPQVQSWARRWLRRTGLKLGLNPLSLNLHLNLSQPSHKPRRRDRRLYLRLPRLARRSARQDLNRKLPCSLTLTKNLATSSA